MQENLKKIYNTYLRISRSVYNKPFKIRENFDSFSEDDLMYLKRINVLFERFSHIDIERYFLAPYKLHGNDKEEVYYGLDYFCTLKAISDYTNYQKKLQLQSPDSKDVIEDIKNGLKYIALFCVEHGILFNDYINYKEFSTYSWMKHYRERKINIYCLIMFDNFIKVLYSVSESERRLFLNELEDDVSVYKTKFVNSKCVDVVKRLVEKIKQVIQEK